MSDKKDKKKPNNAAELTPEDQELKERIELIVNRMMDSDPNIQMNAINQLKNEIKGTTVTMTTIPKHLKFLRPHYTSLCDYFKTIQDANPNKKVFADILSLLAMTISAQLIKKDDEVKEEDVNMEEGEVKEKKENNEEAIDNKSRMEAKEKAEQEAQIEADKQMKIALQTSLAYKLQGNLEDLETYGHEYIRNLSGEIADEYNLVCDELEDIETVSDTVNEAQQDEEMLSEEEKKARNTQKKDKLMTLIKEIVPFQIAHNAETDACDLLIETNLLPMILDYLDLKSRDKVSISKYRKVCIYLSACAPHYPDPEDKDIYKVIYDICAKKEDYCEAFRYALKLDNKDLITECFKKAQNTLVRKQLAFMMCRNKPSDLSFLELDIPEEEMRELMLIASNSKLSKLFNGIVKSLDLGEPKDSEDVFFDKSAAKTYSVKEHLALALGTAFMNAGYCKDVYIANKGIACFRSSDEKASMAAAAGLGLLHLWNLEDLNEIEKFTQADSEGIKAGAYLGLGIANANIRDECDPVLALLNDVISNTTNHLRLIGAIFGLGISYAGTARDDVCEPLIPFLSESDPELVGITALALGLIQLGTANGDLTEVLITVLMEGEHKIVESSYSRFICLGIGLLFLGRGDQSEIAISLTETFPGELARYARVTVTTCAYALTGNVLKIQDLLSICGEHPKKEVKSDTDNNDDIIMDEEPTEPAEQAEPGASESTTSAPESSTTQPAAKPKTTPPAASESDNKPKDDKKEEKPRNPIDSQSVATLGLGLIAADDVGIQMTTRMTEHLLRYGEPSVRKAVPLTLGLLYITNPAVKIIDFLTKLTHDHDKEVSLSAILALGFCCAGTNNSRAAGVLKDLSNFSEDKPDAMLAIRIAQCLLYLGKGALTLSPIHSDHLLLSPVAMAGVLVVLHAALDLEELLLNKSTYLLYALSISAFPRVMQTLAADEATIAHARAVEKKEKEEREKAFRSRKVAAEVKQTSMEVEEPTFVDELTLSPVPIMVRVGQRVDTAGLAGRPTGITGIQTHNTPVLLSYNDRAEMGVDEYETLSNVLEGFVIIQKANEMESI